MATDIAFALAALSIAAPRAPASVRIFLAALAIVDDMGAVLVIALFYSSNIAFWMLGGAGLILLLLISLNAFGLRRPWPYLLLGILLWYFVHESGVHATIAGVALAIALPIRPRVAEKLATDTGTVVKDPVLTFEHTLHRFSAFVVMPVFAFANAGVGLSGRLSHMKIALGIVAGLVVGKSLGITAVSWLAVKVGLAELPGGMSWRLLHGAAWLGGIGFTMSLFIAMLAFTDAGMIDTAKQAILGGSLLAGLIAAVVLRKS
jgi:NhaA family Na+:H+ antiporter